MIIIFILIIYILSNFVCKTNNLTVNKEINFGKTFLSICLIVMRKILNVLFRILTCIDIGVNQSFLFWIMIVIIYGLLHLYF